MQTMQSALAAENEDTIGRPPFHLRNGDLVVWTDVSWRPTEKHIALKQDKMKEQESKEEKNGSKKKKKWKPSTTDKRKLVEGGGLQIRTYEEYMADEAAKKAKAEEEKKKKEEEGGGSEDNKVETTTELTKSDKHKMFDVMVAENEEDLQNPKPRQRHNSF